MRAPLFGLTLLEELLKLLLNIDWDGPFFKIFILRHIEVSSTGLRCIQIFVPESLSLQSVYWSTAPPQTTPVVSPMRRPVTAPITAWG